MELPVKKREAIRQNPRFMVLFGKPKIGKTTVASLLDDNLIIEMEDRGADYVSGYIVDVRSAKELIEVAKELEKSEKRYKYITLDSATEMEDKIVMPLAIRLYQNTVMGKDYKGDDLRKLPMGAGYYYIREAFTYIINLFSPLCETLILIAHCNEKQIDKKGEEMFELEMDLSGKLKRTIAAKADAIGYLYRKENKTMINFNGGGDAIIEARSEHLSNKEFVLVEKTTDGFVNYWDKIFLKE